MDKTNYSGIQEINAYTLESFPNGDLRMDRKRTGLMYVIGSFAFVCFFAFLVYKINDYSGMFYGLGMLIFGVMGITFLLRYLRPDKIYISKVADNFEIKSAELRAKVPAKEIVRFQYTHQIFQAKGTTTHRAGIDMVLRNGKNYLIILLQTGSVYDGDRGKQQCAELAKAMQAAFKTQIDYIS